MSLADPTLAQQLKNIAGDSESITLISEFSKERRPSLSSGINVFQVFDGLYAGHKTLVDRSWTHSILIQPSKPIRTTDTRLSFVAD